MSRSAAHVQVLLDLDRFTDALPLAGQLVATDPENDQTWCLLARCQLGLGRPELALEAARRAAAIAPEHEWPHRLMSVAATTLGRHDEAVHAAREAVRLEPGLWQTHARLAHAADRHPHPGAKAEAARAAAEALLLAPEQPQVHLIHGAVAAGQGRRAVAEASYRTALSLDPQNSSAHHLLAALHLRRRTGPSGLAGVASGFATALSADPSAHASRHSLELTLRIFLGRATYFLFVAAYLSLLFSGRSALDARAIPLFLLIPPALFVVAFVRRLKPPLRSFLRQLLRRRATAAATGLQLLAVLLVLAGVFSPQPARPFLAATAAAVALIARLVLHSDTRRLLRPAPPP